MAFPPRLGSFSLGFGVARKLAEAGDATPVSAWVEKGWEPQNGTLVNGNSESPWFRGWLILTHTLVYL